MLAHNHLMMRAYRLQEKPLAFAVKIVLFLGYYTVIVVAKIMLHPGLISAAQILFILVGFFCLVYGPAMFTGLRHCCIKN